VNVRVATHADLDALAALRAQLVEETFRRPYRPWTWDERRPEFDRAIAAGLVFVADGDQGLDGFAVGSLVREDLGSLDFLHVRSRARRSGVAAMLVAELVQALADRGADFVLVDVDAENTDARAVYEGWDFTECSATLLAAIPPLRERLGGADAR
jgi:ribosomal protein S18 acetylase RimI-like enzyme